MSTASRATPEPGTSSPGSAHDRGVDISGHVLARIGVELDQLGDGWRFRLPVRPVLLDGDGHVSFGVLGVFLDLAASQAPAMAERGHFVHADITLHRLRAPRGRDLVVSAEATRMGKRTGILELELHDDEGVHVARSVQEVVFLDSVQMPAAVGLAARAAFFAQLVGECTLDRPLLEVVQVTRDDGPDGTPRWVIPLIDSNRNGYGGLHGGVATALVDAAAAGALADVAGRPARTTSAALRYLAPSTVGPIAAHPQVLHLDDATGTAVVAVRVRDAEGRTTIVADAHVAVAPA